MINKMPLPDLNSFTAAVGLDSRLELSSAAYPDVLELLVPDVHLLDAVLQRRLRPEHRRIPLRTRPLVG
jgi:hypothetical protein